MRSSRNETCYITKTFSNLLGILEGIYSDKIINQNEVKQLEEWLSKHTEVLYKEPFKQLFDVLSTALEDHEVSAEEYYEITIICRNIVDKFTKYNNKISELHGVVGGIAMDGVINQQEWKFLYNWIGCNQELKGTYPYDEIEALTIKHHKLEHISESDIEIIKHYLNDFCGFNKNSALTHPLNEASIPITSITAVCPEITFPYKKFCFTGKSELYKRSQLAAKVKAKGGLTTDDLPFDLDYLVTCLLI